MSAPLRLTAEATVSRGETDVGRWLDLVGTLSGLPEGERRQLRDELADHIEGRVKDLMLLGRREDQAVPQALAELGDAAKLAYNLRRARSQPRRRTLMVNIGIVVLAGLGVGAGVVGFNAMNPASSVPKSVFEPQTDAAAAPAQNAVLALTRGTIWEEFFLAAGKGSGLPVAPNWTELRDAAILPDTELPAIPEGKFTLPVLIRLINDANRPRSGEEQLDWRIIDGNLVFSTVAAFDRVETVVVTYDLSEAPGIDEGGPAGMMTAIQGTILHHCESDAWVDNGGNRASMTQIGHKLFVKAPKRIHAQIDWILAEVKSTGSPAPIPAAPANPVRGPHASAATGTTIYIDGLIRKPGTFVHAPGMTGTRLIAAAGGALPAAEWLVIVRKAHGMQQAVANVALSQIHKDPSIDPEILPDDVVQIRGANDPAPNVSKLGEVGEVGEVGVGVGDPVATPAH